MDASSRIRRISGDWTVERARAEEEFAVAGWWGTLGSTRAAIFSEGGEFRLCVGGTEWLGDRDLTVRVEQTRRRGRLLVMRGSSIVADVSYARPLFLRTRLDFDHWADEGDFGFGVDIARLVDRIQGEDEPRTADVWPFTRSLGMGR